MSKNQDKTTEEPAKDILAEEAPKKAPRFKVWPHGAITHSGKVMPAGKPVSAGTFSAEEHAALVEQGILVRIGED